MGAIGIIEFNPQSMVVGYPECKGIYQHVPLRRKIRVPGGLQPKIIPFDIKRL